MERSNSRKIYEGSHTLKVFFLDGGFLTCEESAKASITLLAFAGITPFTGEAAAGTACGYTQVMFLPAVSFALHRNR